jgi:hypothetical protein
MLEGAHKSPDRLPLSPQIACTVEFPGKCLTRALGGAIDCGKQIRIDFLHHDNV